MFGIKNLFHQYNQELMEFMQPAPMMGMGYNPMMMGMKPNSTTKPFNPWDPNANKDKDKEKKKDNFWKILLSLGAVGGLGAGGAYLYNQHQNNQKFTKQFGRAAGKYVGVNFDDMLGSGMNIFQQEMARKSAMSQEKSHANNVLDAIVSRLRPNSNNTATNSNSSQSNNNT